MTKNLTARGVKTMLTHQGVDHRPLTFTEKDVLWVDQGRTVTEVTVSGGTKEQRVAARTALSWTGLSCAPYPDYDIYHR